MNRDPIQFMNSLISTFQTISRDLEKVTNAAERKSLQKDLDRIAQTIIDNSKYIDQASEISDRAMSVASKRLIEENRRLEELYKKRYPNKRNPMTEELQRLRLSSTISNVFNEDEPREWDPEERYLTNDVVARNGSIYSANVASIGVDPTAEYSLPKWSKVGEVKKKTLTDIVREQNRRG